MNRILPITAIYLLFAAPAEAQLIDAPYPRQPVPELIQQENTRRKSSYDRTLNIRRDDRLARLRGLVEGNVWTDATARLAWHSHLEEYRRNLLLSLGCHAAGEPPEVLNRTIRVWSRRASTVTGEVGGRTVARTRRGRLGDLEEVVLRGPFGGEITLLMARRTGLEGPSRAVLCVPGIDDYTFKAVRKEDYVGTAGLRAMSEAGLLVIAADLPALTGFSEHAAKVGLLQGRPLPGRISAEISAVVSYLQQRDDIAGHRIAVYGEGIGGFGAALAAAVDPGIWATAVHRGLPSFRAVIAHDGNFFDEWLLPRFLKYGDGADLAALIAPRPLFVSADATAHTGGTAVVDEVRTVAGIAGAFFQSPDFAVAEKTGGPTAARIVDFLHRATHLPTQPWEGSLLPVAVPPAEIVNPRPVSITEVKSAEEWEKARFAIHENIARILGGFPDRGRNHAAFVHQRGREPGFTWEYVIIRTTPEHLLPAIITRSKNVPAVAPAVIHIPGHSISIESDALKLAPELAGQGIVGVFVNQKTGTGFDQGGTRPAARGILEGRPLLGEWAWNLMGIVDYLQTRPDIDSERIGAMGWSMGATTLNYFLPFEPRIKAGVGFVAFTRLKEMIRHTRTADGDANSRGSHLEAHPLYNQVPELLRYCDTDDLLATMAPRPLLSLAGTRDEYFPWQLVQQVFERQRHIYEMLGAGDRLDVLIVPGPHGMLEPMRERAWAFFDTWLKP
ncbi:MAG: alpha/beta hydrolase family protein [Opitutus sp.]